MSTTLLIESRGGSERIALLKARALVEFYQEHEAAQFQVGDIFLGRVKRIIPALNAAFVNIGGSKDAFLHVKDLGPRFPSVLRYIKETIERRTYIPPQEFKCESPLSKKVKISECVSKEQKLLVQVEKVPISTKGPRISCELALAGRYLVLVPFSDEVSVSKKIESKHRHRLTRLGNSIRPKNFGIILRTAAQSAKSEELDRDLQRLLQNWENGMKALPKAKEKDKVIGERRRSTTLLRDLLNEDFDTIWVDTPDTYQSIKGYIKTIAPDKEKIVKLHEHKAKLFEYYEVEKQIKTLFSRKVPLTGGGSLIIDPTEALHVIDVNSGKNTEETSHEAHALRINLSAVPEIARQIRLRDLGGIIIVDFIDMRNMAYRKQVYQAMKEAMKDDRVRFKLLPITQFGLMQLTRQRSRPSPAISTSEKCPTCLGSGKVEATLSTADLMERNIKFLFQKKNIKKLTIILHPYLHAYFTKNENKWPLLGTNSRLKKLKRKFGKPIQLIEDSSVPLTECQYLDEESNEIALD